MERAFLPPFRPRFLFRHFLRRVVILFHISYIIMRFLSCVNFQNVSGGRKLRIYRGVGDTERAELRKAQLTSSRSASRSVGPPRPAPAGSTCSFTPLEIFCRRAENRTRTACSQSMYTTTILLSDAVSDGTRSKRVSKIMACPASFVNHGFGTFNSEVQHPG